MSDEYGKLRLYDPYTGKSIGFGVVTSIQESFQKSGSTIPLVSMDAENAIVIESKTSKVITIGFSRKNPSYISNGSSNTNYWSNAHWMTLVSKAINRWQCRTDGFELTYEPASDNPYIAPIDENGYVRNFNVAYEEGNPEKLKGSFEFHVGTMYVGSKAPSNSETSRKQDDFQILLYSADGTKQYPLLGKDSSGNVINCVDSYTIHGGPEAPFEYVTMSIPKKELKQFAPGLFEGDSEGIIAGKNRLTISAIGTSFMTVTKVGLSNNRYTITAYCDAERVRGYSLSADAELPPASWIEKIIGGNQYGLSYDIGDPNSYVASYNKNLSSEIGNIKFVKGTNVWYILQVCAMCVCARVFFADNKAFVVDYVNRGSSYPVWVSGIDLHPSSGSALYSGATLGDVDLGDEGIDTIVNTVSISCSTPQMKDGSYVIDKDSKMIQFKTFNYYTYSDEDSVKDFKERAANTIYLPELKQNNPDNMPENPDPEDVELESDGLEISGAPTEFNIGDTFTYTGLRVYEITDEGKVRVDVSECTISTPDMSKAGTQVVTVSYGDKYAEYAIVVKLPEYRQVEKFAANYVAYRSEPQQTVSFSLKEMRKVNGVPTWKPYFGPASIADEISDDVNDVYVNNGSVRNSAEKVYQKLALSTYSRSYPEGRSTYTWGVLSTIDLSSNTSQITTSLNNVK